MDIPLQEKNKNKLHVNNGVKTLGRGWILDPISRLTDPGIDIIQEEILSRNRHYPGIDIVMSLSSMRIPPFAKYSFFCFLFQHS